MGDIEQDGLVVGFVVFLVQLVGVVKNDLGELDYCLVQCVEFVVNGFGVDFFFFVVKFQFCFVNFVDWFVYYGFFVL